MHRRSFVYARDLILALIYSKKSFILFGQQLSALVGLVVIEKIEDSHQGYQHDAIAFMFVSLRPEIYTVIFNKQITIV